MKNLVMLFEEFAAVKPEDFKIAPDVDYPARRVMDNQTNYYITFQKKPEYRLEDYTHGGVSHAIIHLKEFNPALFAEAVKAVKNMIMDYVEETSGRRPEPIYLAGQDGVVAENDRIARYMGGEDGDAIVVNTMDYVNDKMIKNGMTTEGNRVTTMHQGTDMDRYKMNNFERTKIVPVLNDMFKAYYNIIYNEYMKPAVYLNDEPTTWPEPYRMKPTELESEGDISGVVSDKISSIVKDNAGVGFEVMNQTGDGKRMPGGFFIKMDKFNGTITYIITDPTGKALVTAHRMHTEEFKKKMARRRIAPTGSPRMIERIKKYMQAADLSNYFNFRK